MLQMGLMVDLHRTHIALSGALSWPGGRKKMGGGQIWLMLSMSGPG